MRRCARAGVPFRLKIKISRLSEGLDERDKARQITTKRAK
jgi:hypothetical protein